MKTASIIITLVLVAASVFAVFNMNISDRYEPLTSVDEVNITTADVIIADTPETHIQEDPNIGELPREPYDYSSVVPESESVDKEYFKKCVFIGDSRMAELIKYTEMEPVNYSSVGFSLAHYDKTTFVKLGEENYTVKDALKENNDYNAVYIATGVNELGWSLESFIGTYEKVIDDIRLSSGDRPVYVQLILPVTTGFEQSKVMNLFNLKNSKVKLFNDAIMEMAKEKQIYVLDCSELFLLEDGTLDPEQSTDGAHLTRPAYNKQYEYYRTHIAPYTLELWETQPDELTEPN